MQHPLADAQESLKSLTTAIDRPFRIPIAKAKELEIARLRKKNKEEVESWSNRATYVATGYRYVCREVNLFACTNLRRWIRANHWHPGYVVTHSTDLRSHIPIRLSMVSQYNTILSHVPERASSRVRVLRTELKSLRRNLVRLNKNEKCYTWYVHKYCWRQYINIGIRICDRKFESTLFIILM